MNLEKELEEIKKTQERILSLLHKALGNVPVSEWGEIEEAQKILDRSPYWYAAQRNKDKTLIEGKDFRRVGGKIEYYLPSIRALKEKLIKEKAVI